jgi:hypothetical protein
MESKIKHLEMVQAVVSRMASNSFLLKGWCVTLVSALLALAARDADKRFALLAYYPVLVFWVLDAYYLRQERLFRKLYDSVRATEEAAITFSMETAPFAKEVAPWFGVMFSATLILFYAVMAAAILIVGALR